MNSIKLHLKNLTQTKLQFLRRAYFRKSLEAVLVFGVYWIQYRYFIFSFQFGSFTKAFGFNHSDALYALSIIYQNLLNIQNGQWYSLAGDHYSWYESIIGTTHHMYAWTGLTWILNKFWQEPIGIYNILYFLNLVILQYGIYQLLRFYTRTRLTPLVVSLLLPLGPSVVGISYGLHPHVAMYASVPWMLYGLEKFKTAVSYREELVWSGLIGLGYLYLLLSDWHSAIFAHVLLVPYALYFFLKNFRNRQMRRRNMTLSIVLLVPILITLPLGLGFLNTSRTFNTTRSLRVVAILQRGRNNLNNSLGLSTAFGPIIENIYPRIPSAKTEPERIEIARRFTNANQLYPDLITTGVFWVGLLVVLGYLILDRSKLRHRSFLFLGVVWLSSLVAFGPYVVIGSEIGTFKLPYYYVYKLIYPLQAIRYIYRIQAVTYLAALLTLGLWLHSSCLAVDRKLLTAYSQRKKKIFTVTIIILLGFGLISAQSITHERTINAGAEYELTISELVADYNQKRQELDYYYFGKDIFDTYNLNLFTSYHNYRRGFRELSWVTHGISGFHPHGERSMEKQMTNGDNYDLIVDTLSGQEVDLIIAHVPDLNLRRERQIEVRYEEIGVSSDKRFKMFALTSKAEVNRDWATLTHAVTFSRTQSPRMPLFYTLSVRNDSPDEIYVKAGEKATTQPYRLVITDSGDREVMSEELAYSEPAHLWPNYAGAQTFEISHRLASGNYTARLFYADKLEDERDFEVISRDAYTQKIAAAPALSVASPELPVPDLTRNDALLPLPVTLTVKTGVWQNYPAKTELRPNYSFAADFEDDPTGDIQNRRDMCALPGNYFANDELNFACNFELPGLKTYTRYRSTFFEPTTQ